jgi:hypothetical protein
MATYFKSLLYAEPYDWLYTTVAQPNAAGRSLAQPRGRVRAVHVRVYFSCND